MYKTAYSHGVLRAFRDVGLIKKADEDRAMHEGPMNANPAEMLADLFGKSDFPVNRPSPDNKTKKDHNDPYSNEPHWGKPVAGHHGAEKSLEGTSGFSMPTISSV